MLPAMLCSGVDIAVSGMRIFFAMIITLIKRGIRYALPSASEAISIFSERTQGRVCFATVIPTRIDPQCKVDLTTPRQHTHHRHPHRNTESYLRQNHRLFAIRHGGINFHAAIHRAGMHDDRIVFRIRKFFRREAVGLEILAGAWQ